jgi:hypothetical protein
MGAIVEIPRMAGFINQSAGEIIMQCMNRFEVVPADEWIESETLAFYRSDSEHWQRIVGIHFIS